MRSLVEIATDSELDQGYHDSLRKLFTRDFVAPFADMIHGDLFDAFKASVSKTVREAPLASNDLEHAKKLIAFMLAAESVESVASVDGAAPTAPAAIGSATTADTKTSTAATTGINSSATAASNSSSSASASAGTDAGTNAGSNTPATSRVQQLWADVIGEYRIQHAKQIMLLFLIFESCPRNKFK